MASARRRHGRITVVVPMDGVLAVRSSAQVSRDSIAEDYEGYRHKGRDYEDIARRRKVELAELEELLGQLGDTEDQERQLTGDYELVRGVVGDVLMEAIRELAVEAGKCWRHEGPISGIDREITVVQERVALLRAIERAADEQRAREAGDDDAG